MKDSISFSTLLLILFIGLKLTDNIDWSWWWVLSPLWIELILIVGIITLKVASERKDTDQQITKYEGNSQFEKRLNEVMRKQRELKNKNKN